MNTRVFGAGLVVAFVVTAAVQGAEFKGRVLLLDGKPAAAGHTVRFGALGGQASTAGTQPVGADGRFTVTMPDGVQQQLWIADSAGRARIGWPHLVKSRDFGDVKLPAAGMLGGQLVAPAGTSVRGVRVILLRRLDAPCTHYVESASAVAGDDGAFLFEGVACGDHACRVESPDFTPEAHAIKVTEDTYLEIHLKKGGAISGVVTGPAGPAAGVAVNIEDVRSPAVSDASGAFSVRGLEGGAHRVTVRGGGWISREPAGVRVDVDEGGSATCSVQVVRSGSLRILLKPADPVEKLPGVMSFNLDAPGQRRRISGYCDLEAGVTNGVAFLNDLPPGTYELALADEAWGTASTQAVIVAERTTETTLVLPRTFTVTGVVVDTEGQPVSRARLRIAKKDGNTTRTRYHGTDESGRFVIRGLAAGRLQAKVEDEEHLPANVEWDIVSLRGEQRIVLQTGHTLTGRVTDETGKAVAGADVRVRFSIPAPTNAGSAGRTSRFLARMELEQESRGAETDAQGRYVVRGLPAGEVRLSVRTEEHEPFEESIVIGPGSREHSVRMLRGLSIAGRVVEDGKPPPVEYEICVYGPVSGEDEEVLRVSVTREATTDPDGSFAIAGLPAGRYNLEARSRDPSDNETVVAEVIAGGTNTVIPVTPWVTVPILVYGPDGSPVENACLCGMKTRSQNQPRVSVYRSSTSAEARTDRMGAGDLMVRRGGRLRLTASRPPLLDAEAEVSIDTAPVPNVVLRMEAGLSLEGIVLDASGKPAPGLRVVSSPRAVFEGSADPDGMSGVTDADGRFQVHGLPAGPAQISFISTNAPTGESGFVLLTRTIAMRRGRRICEAAFRLPPLGGLKGTIRVLSGSEKEHAYITVSPSDPRSPTSSEGQEITTNAPGRFEIPSLPAGEYDVMLMDWSKGTRRVYGVSRVTVKAGETAEVIVGDEFDDYPVRRGRLLLNGMPLAGARVTLIPARRPGGTGEPSTAGWDLRPHSDVAWSDSNGWFEVRCGTGLQFAEVGVRSSQEYRQYTVTANVADTMFDVRIEGAALRGTIRDASGKPRRSAHLHLSRTDGPEWLQWCSARWTASDRNGVFVFDALSPGIYALRATYKEGRTSRPGVVVDREDVTVDVVAEKGVGLRGTVAFSGGGPASMATVFAISEDSVYKCALDWTQTLHPITMDDEGRYEFLPPLPPGHYALLVWLKDYAVESGDIDLKEDTTRDWVLVEGGDLDIRLEGARTAVSGRVVRVMAPDGREVMRPRFFAPACPAGVSIHPTDAEGRLRVAGLRPGRYEVRVDGSPAKAEVDVKAGATAEARMAIP